MYKSNQDFYSERYDWTHELIKLKLNLIITNPYGIPKI